MMKRLKIKEGAEIQTKVIENLVSEIATEYFSNLGKY
jgi:hypothetical protein